MTTYLSRGEADYWRLNQIKRILRAAKAPQYSDKALTEIAAVVGMSDERIADHIANGTQPTLDDRYFDVTRSTTQR